MDNLTHSLVGLLASRAGLNRWVPEQAGLLCVVAANSPDLDIFIGFSPELYIEYHRHLTHSVFAVPVMAAVSVWLTWAIGGIWSLVRKREFRRDPFAPCWAVAIVVGVTHPLLDWTNSYGVRPFLPFSDRWYYGDTLFIIDLAVWGILLAGWWLSRRGSRPAAALALAALVAYCGVGRLVHDRAVGALSRLEIAGGPPDHAAALPAPGTPLDWVGVVQRGERLWWMPLRADRLDAIDPAEAVEFRPPDRHPGVDAAWSTSLGRVYRGFVRFPVTQVKGREVTLADLRFYRGGGFAFACTVRLGSDLRPIETRFGF